MGNKKNMSAWERRDERLDARAERVEKEQEERAELMSLYSDMYKDRYNTRPRDLERNMPIGKLRTMVKDLESVPWADDGDDYRNYTDAYRPGGIDDVDYGASATESAFAIDNYIEPEPAYGHLEQPADDGCSHYDDTLDYEHNFRENV